MPEKLQHVRADEHRGEQQDEPVDRDPARQIVPHPLGVAAGQREKDRRAADRVHDREQPGIDEQKGLGDLMHSGSAARYGLPASAAAYNQPQAVQHNSTPTPVSDPDPQTPIDTPLGLLRRVFGYPSFRGQQQQIIEHVVAGGDALVLMPTGGGKSLCYQLPALLRPGVGVVVSPLIALMKDQVDALRQAGVRAAALNSALPPGEAAAIERALRDGALDLLYVAPERLAMPHCLDLLRALPHRAVRDRRGALHLAMGPRFPPRLPGARHPQGALSRRAAHRADRDRRRADPPRHRRAAASRSGAALRRRLRPARTCSTASCRSTARATTCCAFSTTSIRPMPASSIA